MAVTELGAARLALGIEPIDAAREQRALLPLGIEFDDVVRGNVRPRLLRHPSNRFTLTYDDYFATQPRTAEIRIFDRGRESFGGGAGTRRFVPRRFRIALGGLAQAETQPPLSRVCQPHLFPGAAYPVGTSHTGLRGRVMRQPGGGRPLRPARWVRVTATRVASDPAQTTLIGRAFGDDRGEFLLLIGAGGFLGLPQPTLPVTISVFAPPEPTPNPPDLPSRDPLWDLPLETPGSLLDTDAVLRGTALPAGYAEAVTRQVTLPVARLLRGEPDYSI